LSGAAEPGLHVIDVHDEIDGLVEYGIDCLAETFFHLTKQSVIITFMKTSKHSLRFGSGLTW
jgi:hypothetical protein